jgi:hypothetical protein
MLFRAMLHDPNGARSGEQMRTTRWLIGVTGLLLVVVSLWQIQAAARGLETVRVSSQGVPIVFLGPAGAMDGSRPLVLVAHGFAGSLILPLFPIILLFQAIPNLPQKGSWTYALSGALFVSWMLLAVFPLQ